MKRGTRVTPMLNQPAMYLLSAERRLIVLQMRKIFPQVQLSPGRKQNPRLVFILSVLITPSNMQHAQSYRKQTFAAEVRIDLIKDALFTDSFFSSALVS